MEWMGWPPVVCLLCTCTPDSYCTSSQGVPQSYPTKQTCYCSENGDKLLTSEGKVLRFVVIGSNFFHLLVCVKNNPCMSQTYLLEILQRREIISSGNGVRSWTSAWSAACRVSSWRKVRVSLVPSPWSSQPASLVTRLYIRGDITLHIQKFFIF